MKAQKNIIIKKVKKAGHGGHHGGSWKVAYADFVTAMMAFFLLLWLISMVAPEKRAKLSAYFKSFSLFDKGGTSMMLDRPGGVTGDSGGSFSNIDKELGKEATDTFVPEGVKNKLKEAIESSLADVKDQILVDVFEGGVRIQLTDKEGKLMFPLGGPELTPEAKRILKVITENVNNTNSKLAIEGHTDALSYSSNRYTNWELSTDRASAARKELEHNGLNPDRINRVAGYAATDPLIHDSPNDPRNRRISIILLNPGQKKPEEPSAPAGR
jgi:chemotaxis protein MotB